MIGQTGVRKWYQHPISDSGLSDHLCTPVSKGVGRREIGNAGQVLWVRFAKGRCWRIWWGLLFFRFISHVMESSKRGERTVECLGVDTHR